MLERRCVPVLRGICCKFSTWIVENKIFIMLLLIWFICVMHPLLHTGVILNDEVQALLERKNGYWSLLERNIGCELAQGRPLRIMAAFNSSLSFLSSNMLVNRAIQILMLGITAMSLSAFVKKIFSDNFVSYMVAILFLACMPITFEHAVPNAFVGLVCVPFICLCWSLYFWLDYINFGKKKYLILSMILWIIALCGYEFVVMYTPLFIILYLHGSDNSREKWFDVITATKLPMFLGSVYVACTLLLQKVYGVGYSGVKIQFDSFEQSWQIVKTIICSSIPGYFFINSKYLYLYSLYSDDKLPGMVMQFFSEYTFLGVDVVKFLAMFFIELGNINVFVMLALTFVLILYIEGENNRTFHIKKGYLLTSLLYMLLPSVPNSITSLYQGNVNAVSFTSLPVSMFIFATWCIFISLFIKSLFGLNRLVKYSCVIALLLNIALIQHMNYIFACVHAADYYHVEKTEKLFQTNFFRRLDGKVIYSPDILVTRNALSIGDDYWNKFAMQQGLDLKVVKFGDCDIRLFYTDDMYFSLVSNQEKFILSEKPVNDFAKVKIDDNNYDLVRLESPEIDNGFYIYLCK